MRIGMILDKTFPPDPRVENEAISLVKNGFEVYLFCLSYGNEQKEEIYKGIHIIRFSSNKLIYKLSALAYTVPFYTWIMTPKIRLFIKKYTIESVHIHDIQIAESVFRANKQKLPIVLDLHDNIPEIMKFYPHLQKFPGKQLISPKNWKKKEELFIRKATKVCTVSQEFINEVVKRTKINREKITLVPNTILKSFYTDYSFDNSILEKYKNKFVILYLGDTGLRRGLLTAIDSVSLLKNEIPELKLVIVGKNTTDKVLINRIKELNILKFVDLEGWQDVGLFPSYILSSKVCISPLYRNIQHDVAYANKLFQYMSFAKPVLVSNATAQKNLIEKTNSGLVHVEKDAKDFAAKVLKLYRDENLRKKLGENGKRFVEEEFHWEITSKKLINLYKSLKNN